MFAVDVCVNEERKCVVKTEPVARCVLSNTTTCKKPIHITQQKFLKTGFPKAAYCGSIIVHWWYQMQIPDVKSDQIHIYAPWYVDVNLFSLF